MTREFTLSGKTVLITGGTGSFGREFLRTVLEDYDPGRVIVFSRDELKQHELSHQFEDHRISFFIGDVRDRDRLTRAFQADVDLVVHAAALKQVPACEYNPFEAVKTNILGAKNVIDAAIDCEIPRVLALSTDKAVNPVNLYGATKLCAEKLFIQGNSYVGRRVTRFSCVRYGNVLASRGSIVLGIVGDRKTGQVRITDPLMTRFWMTIEQAVRFVVRCLDRMQGGEVFVPKIPSMRVLDIVNALAPGCQIDVTGIRPGEKLHETLIAFDEIRHTRSLEEMFVIEPEFWWWSRDHETGGVPLPEGFSYTSDTNEQWLSDTELLELVKGVDV